MTQTTSRKPAGGLLSCEEIASRTSRPLRSVQHRVRGWFGRQHDPRVPRVQRERTGASGPPRYLVEADSFEQYCAGLLEHTGVRPVAPPGSALAMSRGCTCTRCEFDGTLSVLVRATCPMHGAELLADAG